MKVATYVVFAECCWFATSAVFDVQYAIPEVLAVGAASLIPDADYPESWLGYRLGRVSKDLNRLFGHRSFLHSLLPWFSSLQFWACLCGGSRATWHP